MKWQSVAAPITHWTLQSGRGSFYLCGFLSAWSPHCCLQLYFDFVHKHCWAASVCIWFRFLVSSFSLHIFIVTESEILLYLIHTYFFFVKSWRPHYPQCTWPSDSWLWWWGLCWCPAAAAELCQLAAFWLHNNKLFSDKVWLKWHHLRTFLSLHTAPSRDTKLFLLLVSYMQ